jgi:hypothetical protein
MVFTFTDFDKAKAKGKKNCSKGLACGAGCISKTKKCKIKMGAGGGAYADHLSDPANLEKGAESSGSSPEVEKIEEQPLTEKFPKISGENPDAYSKETQIGENKVKTLISEDFFQTLDPPPSFQVIGIQINDGYDKSSSIEGKDGLKLALASREHVREYVKAAPEGTVLSNTPYQGDGFGDQRAKLYEKAGFSPPNSDNEMYSIVSGGKNIPITLDEIKALKDAGHFTK